VLVLLYVFIPYKVGAIVLLACMGFFAFSIVPGMQLYVVQLAERHLPGTEDVSSTLNIAAFNIGIAMGAYVGGRVVGSGFGVRYVTLEGALFVLIAFLFGLYGLRKEKG
jgi:predicted MFS family arabinose efflux permease